MTHAHDDTNGAEHQAGLYENPDDEQSGGGAVTIEGCGLLVASLIAFSFLVWGAGRAVLG